MAGKGLASYERRMNFYGSRIVSLWRAGAGVLLVGKKPRLAGPIP